LITHFHSVYSEGDQVKYGAELNHDDSNCKFVAFYMMNLEKIKTVAFWFVTSRNIVGVRQRFG
jgi:hypothetical protein